MARFGDTEVGRRFTSLSDVVARMKEAGEDPERAATWWPAPELTDWLYSPLSGMDSNSRGSSIRRSAPIAP